MNHDHNRRRVVIGVDTHKHVHVAVALDAVGAVIDTRSFPADRAGYEQLLDWATRLGETPVFGIEGTGSYGAGLSAAVHHRGIDVIEVTRPNRRDRRLRGKDDTIDAHNAARSLLSGDATAVPKTSDGAVEMIRQVKIAKDGAVKARTAAMTSLKTVIVNAEPVLREHLQDLPKTALIRRCSGLRPGTVATVTAATKHTLRTLAHRWQHLTAEIIDHQKVLGDLTTTHAPSLVAACGIGTDTAASLLIAAGDNPERIRSEAAWARLCGVAPIPAPSGMRTRHRLHRGGNRHANAALYRAVIVRMKHHQPTKGYLARRTTEGKTRRDIIRCLKRLLAREIWALLQPLRTT